MDIDIKLVKNIIEVAENKLSNLEIKSVENQGHDNRTFHIGDGYTIRIPSGIDYASQIEKEYRWIPYLQKGISYQLPISIKKINANNIYPYDCLINKWIEGCMLQDVNNNEVEYARQCGDFLYQLHKVPVEMSLKAGKHNFYRGGDLGVYANQAYEYIDKTGDEFDKNILCKIFDDALHINCSDTNVFVHGDFVPTNILVQENSSIAIIDFGILGVGDPSCDLTMYWTHFGKDAKEIFKKSIGLDDKYYVKGAGWVIWKQLLMWINDQNIESKRVVLDMIKKYKDTNSVI